jgi:putative FmdB family regulatory protein
MPLYEYKCKKGHVFDAIQSFSEDPLSTCEICGAKAERVLSAPAIHFKGSGFYNTDYGTKRRAKEKDAAAADGGGSSSSSESGSSSSGSSDSGSSAPVPASSASAAAAKTD